MSRKPLRQWDSGTSESSIALGFLIALVLIVGSITVMVIR